MKKISLFLFLLAISFGVFAQTVATIQQVQNVSQANLLNCKDSSSYVGQQVKVRGVVVTSYGLAVSGSGSPLRNIWIKTGTGAFSGLDVFAGSSDPGAADVTNLVAGDSVEVIGTVTEFGPNGGPQVETELAIIQSATVLGSAPAPQADVINLADLNDIGQLNKLPTGEQWEGDFVELHNVEVVAVVYFAGNTRVSFNVKDAAGNMLNVSDRFLIQHLPAAGGSFVPPPVGTVFDTLKGIIMHSPNGCKGFPSGRGYELHPFAASHYSIAVGPPSISNITINPAIPTSTQLPIVSATITDADGVVVSADLHYAVGATNTTYTTIPMTAGAGNQYTATIPAQSNGSFVKYYITATDDSSMTSTQPNVSATINPLVYLVKDNGLDIYDLQYTPFTDGNSIFMNKQVTVTGIVTASAEPNNLGYVFIQQEGVLNWGGIMCLGNSALSSLVVGDKITATGTVKEDFGFTRLESISAISKIGTGTISPLNLDPSILATYSFANNEQYEGMLVTLKAANPNAKIYVTDDNADSPIRFGEYRVGLDTLQPDNGCRILAGRTTTGAINSLNVSYVQDMTAGIGAGNTPWLGIYVDTVFVSYGDCMKSASGILYYSFSNMKLLPRNNADFDTYDDHCNGNVAIAPSILEKVQISAYPSPASEVLNVRFNLPTTMNASIELFDLAGKKVATQTFTGVNGEASVNTTNIANGIYMLNVVSDNTLIFKDKVVIVK